MSINISLKETSFLPLEIVTGTVTWQLEHNHIPKEVIINLKWYTDGKGDEDMQVMSQDKAPQPGAIGSYDFHLTLPQFPWSYEGQLFSIKWCVEAYIDSKNTQSINIVCSPKKQPFKASKTRSELNIFNLQK